MKLGKFDIALLFLPASLFAIGFMMNALVMGVNHSQMPVLIPGLTHGACPIDGTESDVIHTCMNASTHLKFLADWVTIRGLGIACPGDFLEFFGEATFRPALIALIARITKS